MLSSWLAKQEVRDSIPGLASLISEFGYLLLQSRNMSERSLKLRKSSKQPTNEPTKANLVGLFYCVGLLSNRPYPVIWKTVPIRINILKLHQVNFCIENITLSKFQGDTSNSFPDIAFRIYINSYEKLAICTWVGTKYCILPTLNQRVLYLKTL